MTDKREMVIESIIRVLRIALKDFSAYSISYTVAYHKPLYRNVFGHDVPSIGGPVRVVREYEYLQIEMLHSEQEVYDVAQRTLYNKMGLVETDPPPTVSVRQQITIPPVGDEGIDFFVRKLSIIDDMDDEALELFLRLK